MNKIVYVFIIVGLLIWGNVYTQTQKPEEPKTKLETFEKQTGTVIIKGYGDELKILGMGTISVTCMEFTDISTAIRQRGIVIDIKESGRLERTDRSFIDYDEIEPLLKGIDYLLNINSNPTKLSNFEAIYKTKGNLSVSTFSGTAGKIEAVVSSGYIGRASAFISITQLSQLRTVILSSKQRLEEIK